MPKLPRVKASEVIRVLEQLGFVQIRQKGSQVVLKKQVMVGEGEERQMIQVGCVVPLHNKNLAVGTLNNILKQAGVSVEEFIQHL